VFTRALHWSLSWAISIHNYYTIYLLLLLLLLLGWDWVHLVRRPLISLLYQPQMIDYDCGAIGGMQIGRENRSTLRKSAPASFCRPTIPHDHARCRTRAAEERSQRLTAWAITRPTLPYIHMSCKEAHNATEYSKFVNIPEEGIASILTVKN
jgi:hypothetical protein